MTGAGYGAYDGLLIVSFGGPEGPDEVLPFLERVLAGRDVPQARMLEVAEHYRHFGGISPINAQNRALAAAAQTALAGRGIGIPVYVGNRNAPPFLEDSLTLMAAASLKAVLGLYTSPYGSYSGCRQYSRNVEDARRAVGPEAPAVHKLRAYYNHPGFVDAAAGVTRDALRAVRAESPHPARLVFTAHSIPTAMAEAGPYVPQLLEASRLVADAVGAAQWTLAYQSRSGTAAQSWLGPSLAEVIADHAGPGAAPIVVSPIGFLSDHIEVLYDLDIEAIEQARAAGITLRRAATVGTHPRFIEAIVDLVEERMTGTAKRAVLGALGAAPDVCAADCCAWPPQRGPREGLVAPPGTGYR